MKQLYFKNETAKERFHNIEFEFGVTHAPWVTVVTLTNGTQHHGFFHGGYPDSDELAKEHKLRFVIQNKAMNFREELRDKNTFNPECSVIIDVTEIASIELVNPHLVK